MSEKQIILPNTEALVGKDLSKAFKAVRAEKVNITLKFLLVFSNFFSLSSQ